MRYRDFLKPNKYNIGFTLGFVALFGLFEIFFVEDANLRIIGMIIAIILVVNLYLIFSRFSYLEAKRKQKIPKEDFVHKRKNDIIVLIIVFAMLLYALFKPGEWDTLRIFWVIVFVPVLIKLLYHILTNKPWLSKSKSV